MYCNSKIETMPRNELYQLQTEKLQKMIKWTYEKSSFYRSRWESLQIKSEDIQSLTDLQKLPFTTKDQLIANAPFGLLTVPMSGVLRLHMIGQGKKAIAKAYTAGDLGRATEMTARALVAGGVNMTSIVQICEDRPSSDVLGLQYAAEVLGATVVPFSTSSLESKLEIIDKFRVTTLIGEPQYMLQLMVAAQALDYDWQSMSISTIFLTHNGMKNNMADHIASRIGTNVFNLSSLPELCTPGIACECEAKKGFHVQEDYFYPEVVSLSDGQVIQDGRMGELVLTALTAEAMPIIRYRTGVLVTLEHDACDCGRTLARIRIP